MLYSVAKQSHLTQTPRVQTLRVLRIVPGFPSGARCVPSSLPCTSVAAAHMLDKRATKEAREFSLSLPLSLSPSGASGTACPAPVEEVTVSQRVSGASTSTDSRNGAWWCCRRRHILSQLCSPGGNNLFRRGGRQTVRGGGHVPACPACPACKLKGCGASNESITTTTTLPTTSRRPCSSPPLPFILIFSCCL